MSRDEKVTFEWEGVGKLSIETRGNDSAIIRYDPDKGAAQAVLRLHSGTNPEDTKTHTGRG